MILATTNCNVFQTYKHYSQTNTYPNIVTATTQSIVAGIYVPYSNGGVRLGTLVTQVNMLITLE